MKRLFITAIMAAAMLTGLMAQNGEVSEKCLENASLFSSYAKNKDYASALEFWESCYRDCPGATKNIYSYGAKIIEWQMSQTQDAAAQSALFDKLMKLYDDQIIYFGQDSFSRAKIILKKALDHYQYRTDDLNTPYQWMKEAIKTLGTATDAVYFQNFLLISEAIYVKNPEQAAEQYIDDYTMCSEILSANAADSTLKSFKNYQLIKDFVDQRFAASGVADCDKMNSVFAAKIVENKDKADYLERILALFEASGCRETEAYFTASTYSYNITPTISAAKGLGAMWAKKGDYVKAVEYFRKALELSDDRSGLNDVYYYMAICYSKLNNDLRAKECCKNAIEIAPNDSRAYIMLANIYAGARVSDDPILQRSVYWAAVDQLQKARSVETDSKTIEDINKKISQFTQQFPTKEQVFMHNEIEAGKSYYVGGIVSETTTVRAK